MIVDQAGGGQRDRDRFQYSLIPSAICDTHVVRPAANEPGTIGEQFIAVMVSIGLGEDNGTSAAIEWQAARRRVMPHARRGGRR